MIPRETKMALVQDAMKKMYRHDGYFCISTFKNIVEVCGLLVPKEIMEALRLLHCVHFADMEPKTRDWLKVTIDGIFNDSRAIASNYEPVIMGSKLIAVSPSAFIS